jgi:DNA-binding response OmpR family regulator
VVDDEPDISTVYQMVLEDADYECKAYTDSLKALREFRTNYYDLILLDIKMPVLNGFAVLCHPNNNICDRSSVFLRSLTTLHRLS